MLNFTISKSNKLKNRSILSFNSQYMLSETGFCCPKNLLNFRFHFHLQTKHHLLFTYFCWWIRRSPRLVLVFGSFSKCLSKKIRYNTVPLSMYKMNRQILARFSIGIAKMPTMLQIVEWMKIKWTKLLNWIDVDFDWIGMMCECQSFDNIFGTIEIVSCFQTNFIDYQQ